MIDPLLEMRRVAGKFALFLAGIYLLFVYGIIMTLVLDRRIHVIALFLAPIPAAVFVPSVIAAIKLHRTTEPEQLKRLWRRSLVLAVIGTAMLFAVAFIVQKVDS